MYRWCTVVLVADRIRFEWDPAKAKSNHDKHGVSFDEATTVFGDRLATTVPSPVGFEDREITTGLSESHRVLLVVHLDDGDTIRIISARKATASERRTYEEGE